MTSGADARAVLIQDAVIALSEMERLLKATQAEVTGLGFFARGFVEKDIKSATGRSFADWLSAVSRLRSALLAAESDSTTNARQTIDNEATQVNALRQYLQRAPQKINLVPAAVLKPQQRAEFLRRVSEQEQSLLVLETKLRAITASLS